MLLQIVSDVHLEFYGHVAYRPVLEKFAPYLALLGDIGKPFSEGYKKFIADQSAAFDKVFVLIGNHELYSDEHDAAEVIEQARAVCEGFHNVFFLERAMYDISEKTVLLGCTLWSDIDSKAADSLNDFRKIRQKRAGSTKLAKLTPDVYQSWHERDVKWIQDTLDELRTTHPEKKAVVLTHHAPHKSMDGEYYGNRMSSAFTTDLTNLFRDPVIAFANGHVHSNCDLLVNNIRCVSNAMGYPGEQKRAKYNKNVTVEFE